MAQSCPSVSGSGALTVGSSPKVTHPASLGQTISLEVRWQQGSRCPIRIAGPCGSGLPAATQGTTTLLASHRACTPCLGARPGCLWKTPHRGEGAAPTVGSASWPRRGGPRPCSPATEVACRAWVPAKDGVSGRRPIAARTQLPLWRRPPRPRRRGSRPCLPATEVARCAWVLAKDDVSGRRPIAARTPLPRGTMHDANRPAGPEFCLTVPANGPDVERHPPWNICSKALAAPWRSRAAADAGEEPSSPHRPRPCSPASPP